MKIFSANLNKEIVWFDDTYAVILKYLFEAQFMQKYEHGDLFQMLHQF